MSIHGGRIADFPGPHRRKFDDRRRKRTVTVEISTFEGFCAGAVHYYLTFRVEDNPLWDEEEQTWRTCWDDPEAKYELPKELEDRRHREYLSHGQALRAAKPLVERHFPESEWKVMYGNLDKRLKEIWRKTKGRAALDGD